MSEPETPQQRAEAAAIRRRWITLGEILAVAAVVISGLTFWNSYQERSSAEAEKAAAKQAKSQKAQTLILSASTDGRVLPELPPYPANRNPWPFRPWLGVPL